MKAIAVRFGSISELPDCRIDPGAGPASRAVCERGLLTLRDAASWLRDLPYAPGVGTGPLRAVESGFGDCSSKHGALIAVSQEQGLSIGLIWGLYALDASLVPAVEPILGAARLPFVPNIHCFLQSGHSYFDLTEGNCTGKSRQVQRYLALFAASPSDSERPVRLAMAQALTAMDGRFVECTPSRLMEVTELCVNAKATACPALAPTGTAGTPERPGLAR